MCLCRCTGGGESSRCSVECHRGFSITIINGKPNPPQQVYIYIYNVLWMFDYLPVIQKYVMQERVFKRGFWFGCQRGEHWERERQRVFLPTSFRVALQSFVPLFVTFSFLFLTQHLWLHSLLPPETGLTQLNPLWMMKETKQILCLMCSVSQMTLAVREDRIQAGF